MLITKSLYTTLLILSQLSVVRSIDEASQETCGNGYVGDGICADGNCCSINGWCGITDLHCTKRPPYVLRLGGGGCGYGVIGSGACPVTMCCSSWGYCGTGNLYCTEENQTNSSTTIPVQGSSSLTTRSPTPGPTSDIRMPTLSPRPPSPSFPTPGPTLGPTPSPTPGPTLGPTPGPTSGPTLGPTPSPTPGPTVGPTPSPTPSPTPGPTVGPTPSPTPGPTVGPTPSPTPGPTPVRIPLATETSDPTPGPTPNPTSTSSFAPSTSPTPVPCMEVDDTEYQCGAPITATFNFADAYNNDWIGIYTCDTNIFVHAKVWKWSCGSARCQDAITTGSVVFDSLPYYNNFGPHAWPVAPTFDNRGRINRCFKAVYLRNDGPSVPPYEDLCESNTFTIQENDSLGCQPV